MCRSGQGALPGVATAGAAQLQLQFATAQVDRARSQESNTSSLYCFAPVPSLKSPMLSSALRNARGYRVELLTPHEGAEERGDDRQHDAADD